MSESYSNPISASVTITADTEFSSAAALADNTANPTTTLVGAMLMAYDGTTWDRVTIGAGTVATALRATLGSDDPAVTALQIMDDWDESDRAKVNLIVGQAGIAGGTGVDGATVPRVTLATNVALPAGTNAIGKLAANSGVDIGDVDITSVIPGTGATNSGKAVDSVAGATDTGVAILAVRDDALAALTPIDGDYVQLRVDSQGSLWTSLSGPVALNVTRADDGAFAVGTDQVIGVGYLADESATDSIDEGDIGIPRMTLNRRPIIAGQTLDDAAFGIGTEYVQAIGYLVDDTATDSVDEGDIGAARMSLDRIQYVRQNPPTTTHTTTSSSVGDSAASVTLLAANSARTGAAIRNDSTAILYVELGATATTSSVVRLTAQAYYELPILAGSEVYRGIITGIWDSDAGGNARISESV